MKKKKFWSSDRIVSITAMFISIITLFIFVKQTNIMDRQSKLSAMPYLMMSMSNRGEEKIISVDVKNLGLGPAIIEDIQMSYKGKKYEMSLLDFMKSQVEEMDSVEYFNINEFRTGLAIPAENTFNIITAGGSNKGYEVFSKAVALIVSEEFDFEIVYKSVYNDEWKIQSKTNEPIKID